MSLTPELRLCAIIHYYVLCNINELLYLLNIHSISNCLPDISPWLWNGGQNRTLNFPVPPTHLFLYQSFISHYMSQLSIKLVMTKTWVLFDSSLPFTPPFLQPNNKSVIFIFKYAFHTHASCLDLQGYQLSPQHHSLHDCCNSPLTGLPLPFLFLESIFCLLETVISSVWICHSPLISFDGCLLHSEQNENSSPSPKWPSMSQSHSHLYVVWK